MKAVNIQWDTDGDEEALASLPTEVEIPEAIAEDDDAISDWLSDRFGFCHFGFANRRVTLQRPFRYRVGLFERRKS